jgi:hypothetical protein
MAMPRLVRREYRQIASGYVRNANTLAIAVFIEQALCLCVDWKLYQEGWPEGRQTAAGYRQFLQARERLEKTARALT